jgi:hypothetical protein
MMLKALYMQTVTRLTEGEGESHAILIPCRLQMQRISEARAFDKEFGQPIGDDKTTNPSYWGKGHLNILPLPAVSFDNAK